MPRKPAPKVEKYEGKRGTTYRVRIRHDGRQGSETFDTYTAANAFALTVKEDGVEAALEARRREDRRDTAYVPTLTELLDRHINDLTGVDQRTKEDYRSIAARSFLPILGKLRVDRVDRGAVSKFVNARDGVVAPKTIKNEHSLLSSVLETAVRDGHLAANPARGTRLPRTGEHEEGENRYLTYAEFDQLYAAFAENKAAAHFLPLLVLLFGTGLRFSEATALQVQDINIEAGTLRVMRAWKREKGGRRIGPPKSKKSRRTIRLDETTMEHIAPLLEGRKASDWLFTTVQGNPIRHSNFYNRYWVTACQRAGLDPRPRIHDARHTHASWLIANNVRLEVVQDRLGHEDYTTTRKVYGHLLPDMHREAGIAAGVAFANTALGHPTKAITGPKDDPAHTVSTPEQSPQ